MTDIEESSYQVWKSYCIDSINNFSWYLKIPEIDLVEFAYKNYPDDFRKDGDIDRLYKELMEYFHE